MSYMRDHASPEDLEGELAASAGAELRVRGILPPGARVGGCTIERHIASGNFGSVYAAKRGEQGQRVAVKVLHPELINFGEPFVRFLREARILDLIRHPNVVRVFDSGVLSDGRAFLVMEHLEGSDLAAHLLARGRLSQAEVADVFEPICAALAHAHQRGVVHRGLKPSNVFLCHGAERRVVLLDFVLAKLSERGALEVTSSRVAVGSPVSLAPEQIRGQSVDARSDVYGLGALLYHMLTGHAPFEGRSWAEVQRMHLHAPRPRASLYGPVSPHLDEVIMTAMSTEPGERYDSASAFMAALQAALSGEAEASGRSPRPVEVAADAAGEGPALAVHVSVYPRESADQHSDDAVLDAIDQVLEHAARVLGDLGFVAALESSSATLFVSPLERAQAASVQRRRRAAEAALAIHRGVDSERAQRLLVRLALCCSTARFDDDETPSGEVLRVERWVPDNDVAADLDGVIGHADVFAGIGAEVTSGPGDLLRLVDVSAALPPVAEHLPPDPRVLHLEMMAQIGRHTAGIVHDLRSPLTVIRGSLELFLDHAADDKEVRDTDLEMLENAYQCAQQMSEMVAFILETSALRSYTSGARKRVAVAAVVDNALKLVSKDLRRRAEIFVRHDGESWVMGSAVRLTQALVNLIVNATQAIPEHGRIDIETQTVDQQRVRIEVRDTGVGISPEVQARIFEPYFSTKSTVEGSGLGLALVHAIVKEHEGQIELASTSEDGSCFVIDLPAAS
ncbi:protein kinase domain-containing protein [Haliangium sp.]|uniref:protein kinase domain-containing protein n=1 Tax=Haliangium sp. TaxID=2663208 RepID=UPI003D0A3A12